MTQSVDTAAEPTALPSPKERRRLRESGELTHDEIAAAVGVTATTVRSWESGRTEPRGRNREVYARLLVELGNPAKAAGEDATSTDTDTGTGTGTGTDTPDSAAEAASAEESPAGSTALRVAGAVRAFAKGGGGHAAPAGTRPKAAAKRASKPPAGGAGSGRVTGSAHTGTAAGRPAGSAAPSPTDRQDAAAEAAATATDGGTSGRPHGTADDPASAPTAAAPVQQPEPRHRARQEAPDPEPAPGEPPPTAAEAFDALYGYAAPALLRQTYLLTGRRGLARDAVERAFQRAWNHWPKVATDPDPVGWVRAAAYEYALSPWHRHSRKHPDRAPADPADRILLDAMLALSPTHRRTVLLYDGIGLDLPDTAAETEASTPTAGNRLVHAHAHLADRLPELDGVPEEKQSALLHDRLGTLTPAVRLEPRPASVVRLACEHRNRFWARAAIGLTAVIAVAATYTAATAPTQYHPPIAPGASVSGVPPHHGPQPLTEEDRQLREKLRSEPATGPARLVPKTG
ncbi:helix-turn-helix domain-containing protein [Streptomyces sp. NPDC051211]|uniref:helix-turn-helix domain-containing protein n=1 Tax=Streptomyces sp. NPDC051211 TaxID=3154643 RepID=UPI00344B7872